MFPFLGPTPFQFGNQWDMKVKASIAYLERAVGRGIENHRDLALVTYALVLGKSEDAATALDQLNHHAIRDGNLGTLK